MPEHQLFEYTSHFPTLKRDGNIVFSQTESLLYNNIRHWCGALRADYTSQKSTDKKLNYLGASAYHGDDDGMQTYKAHKQTIKASK